jgi:dTMP kinase
LVGLLIAIEGLDGSGKSTLARRLADAIEKTGRSVVLTREPGGTAIGEGIRRLLLDDAGSDLRCEAEALLFAASRAQLVGEVIEPALKRGAVVIVDRFIDSSLAYQGGGRGLDLSALRGVQEFATGGLDSDLKVLLDVAPEVALNRRRQARELTNRLDDEDLVFYDRVRSAYLDLARHDPARWRVVGAGDDVESVWREVWGAVESRLASSEQREDGHSPATAARS